MNPLHLRFDPMHSKIKTMKKKKIKKENDDYAARVEKNLVAAMVKIENSPQEAPGSGGPTHISWGSAATTDTREPISEKPKMKKKKQKINEGGVSEEDSKVGEKRSVADSEPVPMVLVRSVLTEQDEITILKSMVEYAKLQKVSLPLATFRDFYPFLKGKLSADFTNAQIYDKIRRLRDRYFTRLRKKCGEVPILYGDHGLEVYMISKNIWGVDSNRVEVDEEVDNGQIFCSKYPLLMESLEWENSSSFSKLEAVKENIQLIGSAKASEMEMEWMKLKCKEQEIHSGKMNVKMQLMRTVLNAMNEEGLGSSPAAM